MNSEESRKRIPAYVFYLIAITLVGVGMVSLAVVRLALSPPVDPDLQWLFGLIGLVVVAQVSALLAFQNIDLSVASAVSLAAVPLFGPLAAALVAAIGELALWAIRQYRERATLRERGWVMVFRPLGFNVGMVTISLFVAGQVFVLLTGWMGAGFWAMSLIWLATAVVSSQVNMWLLIILLRMLTGAPLMSTWNEHRWVVPIDVLVPAVGGAVIAQAVEVGNFLAVLIFFLPIILSAFALHLYARGMERQKALLEQKVAERTAELESTNKDLLRVSEEKDEFLAILTHDMRTPLTSIKGYISILRDRDLPKSQQKHIAKIVLRAGDNLLELVNNILDIENIRGGGVFQIVMEPLDLAQIAHSVTEDLFATAAEKQIELVCQAPNPVNISADRSIIRRVVTNLVSNALKYSPEGGKVWVTVSQEGDTAVLSVQDTGYGIPEEDLPYIFDEYNRVAKHAGLSVGTGLGLAIVKRMVEAHKGSITVRSVENKGSTFSITLPITAVA